MRRLAYVETTTRAGRASVRLAWFGLFVALGGLLVSRRGLVDPLAVLAVIGAGWLLSAIALALAITGLIIVWRTGARGAGAAFAGLLIALVSLAWPAIVAIQMREGPGGDDVATDLADPPACAVGAQTVGSLWAFRGLPLKEGAGAVQALPLYIDLPAAKAVASVEQAVHALGWRTVATEAGAGGGARIEAMARSDVLAFPQQVCMRVRPSAGGAQLDVRVRSPYGWLTPRAGFARITDLQEAVQAGED